MKSVQYVEFDVDEFAPDTQVKILLNFEGADADTGNYIDDAPIGNFPTTLAVPSWSSPGNAQLDTADKKFGVSSALFDGTGDNYETSDIPEYTLGSGAWTVDFWFKCNVAGGSQENLFGQCNSSNTAATTSVRGLRTTGNVIQCIASVSTTNFTVTGTTQFTNAVNTGWHHVAFVRTGNILRMFIDGIQEGGDVAITGTVNDSSNNWAVGQMGAVTTNPWTGWIDSFRMTVGTARWTANFSVPTTPMIFEDDSYRFAMDTNYLPATIDAIPSMTNVAYTPAIVSLGEDMGQRATLRLTFKDHKHRFASESFDSGSFWGKFRARYGNKLRGTQLKWIVGLDDQDITLMNTRYFVIESVEGPFPSGTYTIIAKDGLKLADDDRAQAPRPSSGQLNTTMTTSTTSVNLTPSGVGNLEYPASGAVNIGGSEICTFTRVADALTLTRAQMGTVAVDHAQGERMQLVLSFSGVDPAVIIQTLLEDYAGVDPSYINITAWTNETTAYLQRNFTANIAEPTGVNKLISEIIEQAALAVWWDDVAQQVRLQVLRPIATDAATFDEDNTIQGSLKITEQPNTRISQVFTYFNIRNPLQGVDDTDNYKSAALTVDLESEDAYGMSVKKIFSRWIPSGGRTTATRLNDLLIGRFKDAPRKFNLDLFRYGPESPALGAGYRIESWCLQNIDGTPTNAPVQAVRVNPLPDRYQVELQEMLFTDYEPDDPSIRTIILDADQNNVNLRTIHDNLYPAPTGAESPALTINCIIETGVIIGSERPVDGSTPQRSFDVGTWPAGPTINITINGEIQGHGGKGGTGGGFPGSGVGVAGKQGGTAFYTRRACNVINNGFMRGGGGGGGGAGGVDAGHNQGGGGGGGGRGRRSGQGGAPGADVSWGTHAGEDGIPEGTGIGGQDIRGDTPTSGKGGDGGDFATAGSTGQVAGLGGGTGGAAGVCIDGVSFVTMSGPGTEQGSQIN